MFSGIEGFSDQLFTVLVLLVVTSIATGTCFTYGSRKAQHTAFGLFLILIVGVQLYYLIFAALHIPADQFMVYNTHFHRTDCIESAKGGKRPGVSQRSYDLNPCFCNNSTSACLDSTTRIALPSNVTCPTDGSAVCVSKTTLQPIDYYLSHLRDCRGGQGKQCTKDQPCTPCDIDSVIAFGSDRCRSCSTDNRGDCNFVPGVGPYCLDRVGSKLVVPCKVCCTQAAPKIVNETCY